jgi:hypothetical protein
MGKQVRHIEVIGVGTPPPLTPPPLAIRPLFDEVLRILDQRSGRSGGAIADRRSSPPTRGRAGRTRRE